MERSRIQMNDMTYIHGPKHVLGRLLCPDLGRISNLLSSTSFVSPLLDRDRGNWRRPLVSFAPLLAGLLAACEGGGISLSPVSSSAPPPLSFSPVSGLSGRVFDGPVVGARVYADVDGDGAVSDGDFFIGTTDDMGAYRNDDVPSEHLTSPIIALLDGAIDIGDPTIDGDEVEVSGIWRAPVGSRIISPLTELLVRDAGAFERFSEVINIPSDLDITQYDPYDRDGERIGTNNDVHKEAIMHAGEVVARELAKGDGKDDIVPRLTDGFRDQVPSTLRLSVDSAQIEEGIWQERFLSNIIVHDDGLGSYAISLSDDTLFELRTSEDGTHELWLRPYRALDYETTPVHEVTISIMGTGKGVMPQAQSFKLEIQDQIDGGASPPQTLTYRYRVRDNDNPAYELDGANVIATAHVGEKAMVFIAGEYDNGVSVFEISAGGMLTHLASVDDSAHTDYKLTGAFNEEIANSVRVGNGVVLGYWKVGMDNFVLNQKNKSKKDNWSENDLVVVIQNSV